MILPVYAYGQPVLKKVCIPITADYPGLEDLVNNMWETMYNAHGVGLAAPQIGLPIRMFIVDTVQVMDEERKDSGIKEVFINAEIVNEDGEAWEYEEGCLSIPTIRGDVERLPKIRIKYLDLAFNNKTLDLEGINARVVQHEYDHIEGKLFTEKLKPVKKRMIKRKLDNIKKGKVEADYRLKFFHKK